jgi:crossover junction endodeoxyribonuclease RuvC
MARILGIDPGTASTGYAIVDITESLEPILLKAAVISTKAHTPMPSRLRFLYEELYEISNEFSPEIMVVEKLFFNTNVKTAITVGQARGIPLLIAGEKDIEVIEYTALEAKLSVAGYGRANKKEVQEAVRKYIGLKDIIKPDDANDAVAMALCFLERGLKNAPAKSKPKKKSKSKKK